MQQLSFWGEPSTAIVNVAQVPQRSPFRYPGGKTWLVPRIRRWLAAQPRRPTDLIEPFAGGGSVGLTAAFEHWVDQATLVELDDDVAVVWEVLIHGEGAALAERVGGFSVTPQTVAAALETAPLSAADRAFQTILRNRINRGGILAPGAGRVKQGENGKGLTSRWYPATLRRRMLDIVAHRSRLRFIHGDGLSVLRQYADQPDAVFFLDPPYTAAGKRAGQRLYSQATLDHAALFDRVARLRGDFLMTYDVSAEVRALAARHGFATQTVPMHTTHHTTQHELLIGRDLSWLRP